MMRLKYLKTKKTNMQSEVKLTQLYTHAFQRKKYFKKLVKELLFFKLFYLHEVHTF